MHVVSGGYGEAVAYIGELWQQQRNINADHTDFRISVSAPTNHDAHEISVAIRERRRVLGEVGLDQATIKAADVSGRTYDLALAEGDRVRLFKRVNATFAATKTEGNIGRNGTVLEILGFADHGLMLRTPTGKVGLVAWTTLRDRDSGLVQLDYGDALTTNTARGSTVTEHIHAMPAGSHLVSAFGAYTSGSRHREKSFVMTSDGAERAKVIGRLPSRGPA